MSYSEDMSFEYKLAYNTAPTLLGIKPACLYSVKKGEISLEAVKQFNIKAAQKGIRLRRLCMSKGRELMLLYREDKLARQLFTEENMKLLVRFGYSSNMTVYEMLDKLSGRIAESENFPHEIGIFLGYPPEDVLGFIENGGSNYKLCGYWKVYDNAEKAKKIFENYNKCRNFLFGKLNQGTNIYEALKIA